MAKTAEFSSILLTALQQVFQCGALNEVSDYVALTTAQTGKPRNPSEQPSSTTTRTATTAAAAIGEQDESSIHQDHVPALQASHSSASSIYVVPSREALEEMVRGSRSTRRQGLFDMDRMFTCGSRDSVVDDDLDDDDENLPASTSSVFSRCVSKTSGGKEPTITVTDSKPLQQQQRRRSRRRRNQRQPEDHDCNVEYHFKIHLSPPRTDVRQERRDHWDYALRRTMSDTLQQLPEAKSSDDSGFTE